MSTNALPQQSGDFPAWYGEVVRRAGLAENSSVRGAMVIKPYGYAIWELIQRALDERIKETGHENVYFPLLVPASVLAQDDHGMYAEIGIAFGGIHQTFRTRNEHVPGREVAMKLVDGPFSRLDGQWRFTPLAGGTHSMRPPT